MVIDINEKYGEEADSVSSGGRMLVTNGSINREEIIETVLGWSEILLNNRLLLKGITFAKMYDTFWQKPFYIKIT